jgi:hypothetical protein
VKHSLKGRKESEREAYAVVKGSWRRLTTGHIFYKKVTKQKSRKSLGKEMCRGQTPNLHNPNFSCTNKADLAIQRYIKLVSCHVCACVCLCACVTNLDTVPGLEYGFNVESVVESCCCHAFTHSFFSLLLPAEGSGLQIVGSEDGIGKWHPAQE